MTTSSTPHGASVALACCEKVITMLLSLAAAGMKYTKLELSWLLERRRRTTKELQCYRRHFIQKALPRYYEEMKDRLRKGVQGPND